MRCIAQIKLLKYMAKYEIERKFLLNNTIWEQWKEKATEGIRIVQGYLSRRKESTVRVRIAGEDAWLTVKGVTEGDIREEYEYPVPIEDAERMIRMCEDGVVEKTRWKISYENLIYEIDIFEGRLSGLMLCEVELPERNMEIKLPPFVGVEVTGDSRYYNSNL